MKNLKTLLFVAITLFAFSSTSFAQDAMSFIGDVKVTKGTREFIAEDVVYDLTFDKETGYANLAMTGLRFAPAMPSTLVMSIDEIDFYTQDDEIIVEFLDRNVKVGGKNSDSPLLSSFNTPLLNFYSVIKDGKIQSFFDCGRVTVEYNGVKQ